jgi:hypothetical protein
MKMKVSLAMTHTVLTVVLLLLRMKKLAYSLFKSEMPTSDPSTNRRKWHTVSCLLQTKLNYPALFWYLCNLHFQRFAVLEWFKWTTKLSYSQVPLTSFSVTLLNKTINTKWKSVALPQWCIYRHTRLSQGFHLPLQNQFKRNEVARVLCDGGRKKQYTLITVPC